VANCVVHMIVSGSILDTKIQSWDQLVVIVGVASSTHNFGQDDQFLLSSILCNLLCLSWYWLCLSVPGVFQCLHWHWCGVSWRVMRVLIPLLLCPSSTDSSSLYHFCQDLPLQAGKWSRDILVCGL